MTPFRKSLEEYLSLRRGLGSDLYAAGARLYRFVEFLEREGASVITADLALRWATETTSATSATWAQRLGDARRFASWLSATDPRTEVPSRELLPHRYRRRPPYIYRDDELARIVREAARLTSPVGLRALTYSTLFGLLAATGLRLGEALALDRDDVDLHAGVLKVRHGKFGKARFVPLHDSACEALRRYARQRDSLLPRPSCAAFLVSDRGRRVTHWSAEYNFAVVSRAVGLRLPAGGYKHGRGPRLHDMRHRLAARTLVRWYREGRDVDRELPKLAMYLGHGHVSDTYWYIEAIPELLQLAVERAAGPRREAP
jgi:site-specific recombinase XerD